SLCGEVSTSGNFVALSGSAVIAKVLTGWQPQVGVISAADSILTGMEKTAGNIEQIPEFNGILSIYANLAPPAIPVSPSTSYQKMDTVILLTNQNYALVNFQASFGAILMVNVTTPT